jgi:hypothetical protein
MRAKDLLKVFSLLVRSQRPINVPIAESIMN